MLHPTNPLLKKLLCEQSTVLTCRNLYFLNAVRQLLLDHIVLLRIETSWHTGNSYLILR